jgi:hypothetical protein
VGFFGSYLWRDGGWVAWEPGERVRAAEPWLAVAVHDSDLAAVEYRPAGRGTGTAFLGVTPRTYFEDAAASAPTDVGQEAAGLASWWAAVHSTPTRDEVTAKAEQLAGFLAADADEDAAEDAVDDEELDDAEIFVEIKAARFLAALDLTLPDDLQHLADDEDAADDA